MWPILGAPAALSAAISQGFSATDQLTPGTIVATNSGDKQTVVAADPSNSGRLVGIVVSDRNATLQISGANDKVQVATTGNAVAFVSDINGPILAGDQITASPIKGIGMRATDPGTVVGIAGDSFTSAKATKTMQVKANDGKNQTVSIGVIPVTIQVAYYGAQSKSVVPSFLQRFANTVAGKQVSAARVIIAFLVMLISILTIIVILFSAVRSALISIGRNPLARASIYRGLMQVSITCFVILGVAVGSIFLILSQ
jgi:hypothetical protein